MLSGVSLLAVSHVNNPVGLVGLPYVMWSAHFFVTHIQMEKISSWNGPTAHVCCFMLARASTKTFISRIRKTAKKIFVSQKNSLAGSLVSRGITVFGTYRTIFREMINKHKTLWFLLYFSIITFLHHCKKYCPLSPPHPPLYSFTHFPLFLNTFSTHSFHTTTPFL